MIPIFPSAMKLFEEKNLSVSKFDALFHDISTKAKEGFFIVSGKEGEVYLFVVGGRPYGSGRIESSGPAFYDVEEFFETFVRIGSGSLSFYQVEKKLLLGILVYFKKTPAQKFSADVVDMEKVFADLAARGADSLIVTQCENKMGLLMCLKGKPSFSYLPDNISADEGPKEGLLLYIYGVKGCVPTIEIFDDIQMVPAADAIPATAEVPKGITAHYAKIPASPASVSGAEIILALEGKVLQKFPVARMETTIGRGTGSDVLLDNPAVSRHHAVIREKGGKFIIEDKGSTNGTFVGGEKVTARELKDNDQISIVRYLLTFKYPSAEKGAAVETGSLKVPASGQAKVVLEDGKEFLLKSTVLTIGSGEEMEVRLEGRSVAEHQLSILRGKGGEFTLMHKGGRTATKVNGAKIDSQHPLKNGDVIEVGDHKLKYIVS